MTISLKPIKPSNFSLSNQAQNYLLELFKTGAYGPGQQLPSEADLAEQLGISRPTLREALQNLELEGTIVRKHGVGTFFSNSFGRRLESGLEILESIDQIASRKGLQTHCSKLEIEEREPTSCELSSLGLVFVIPILLISRTILVANQPIAFLKDIVPLEFLHKTDLETNFNGSVLDLLLKKYKSDLSHSFTNVDSVKANIALSRQLQIKPSMPLLRLEAKLFLSDGRIIDFSTSHFVPGYFDFHVIRKIGTC
ncbi:MAG: GntR family transcriptional regulator [Anaerolineaceae bacterium]